MQKSVKCELGFYLPSPNRKPYFDLGVFFATSIAAMSSAVTPTCLSNNMRDGRD